MRTLVVLYLPIVSTCVFTGVGPRVRDIRAHVAGDDHQHGNEDHLADLVHRLAGVLRRTAVGHTGRVGGHAHAAGAHERDRDARSTADRDRLSRFDRCLRSHGVAHDPTARHHDQRSEFERPGNGKPAGRSDAEIRSSKSRCGRVETFLNVETAISSKIFFFQVKKEKFSKSSSKNLQCSSLRRRLRLKNVFEINMITPLPAVKYCSLS